MVASPSVASESAMAFAMVLHGEVGSVHALVSLPAVLT
jgi:hypothetical protein